MDDKTVSPDTRANADSSELSETWAEDAQNDLEEFIELQGVHIRQ